MELELIRTYYPKGNHGRIFYSGCLMMYNIEHPWKGSHAGVSWIPEGNDELITRCSPKQVPACAGQFIASAGKAHCGARMRHVQEMNGRGVSSYFIQLMRGSFIPHLTHRF